MTDRNALHNLKSIAKRYARERRVAHHVGLDWLAGELNFPHWKALTVAYEKGWRPETSQLEALGHKQARPDIHSWISFPDEDDEIVEGDLEGYPYQLVIDSEVHMWGRGWAIHLGEAPSEAAKVEVTDRRIKANPILEDKFRAKAVAIAGEAAETLRAQIASDWPRRSTKPDAKGRVVHPLWANSKLSNEWHCLHCDGAFSGKQMAENMWHCPECNATPIDIFAAPFWKAAS